MNLPREYISYNQVRQYQTCPQKYYYTYIENVHTPINERIFLGTVFHAVVENYLKEKINSGEVDKATVADTFNQTFDQLQSEMEVVWESSEEKCRQRGISLITYFFGQVAPHIDPLMVEKELEIELPTMGIKLKGIIDLVEKDFSITDFKTTTSRWSPVRAKNAFLQMVIYKYLMEQSFGTSSSELKFIIVYAKNKDQITHQCLHLKSSDVNVEKMLTILEYVVDSIRREVFHRNESFNCRFCDYRHLCRPPA